jgi:glucose-6-phosphate-specific signal transduction histidine kinase
VFNWHIGRLGALRQRNELLGALRLDGAGRYGAHAAAKTVSLIVERGEDRLRVIIEDDGKGLDRDAAMAPGQLGLVGIKERLALIGGTLSIEAASPTGTTLVVTVPLAKAARAS